MALPVIQPSDFKGLTKISLNDFTEDKFQDLIDELYPLYVRDLLGDEAYLEIRDNDLEKWNDLLKGGNSYTYEDKKCINDGLIYSIQRMIFFEGIREGHLATIAGNTRSDHSNSTRLTNEQDNVIAMTRYNEGVINYFDSVVPFITAYRNMSEDISSIDDLGGGQYRINVSSTKYLYDGDSVEIGGIDYVISNTVEGISFEITSVVVVDDDYVIYSPFEVVDINYEFDIIIP